MSLEVLKDIKSIEVKAAERVEESRQQALERITAAKKTASEEMEKARAKAKVTIQEALDSAKEEADKESRRLRDKHRIRRDELQALGGKNMDRAVSLIVERILG